jgi:hypothetical protein
MSFQDLLTAIGPIDKTFTTLAGRSTFKARAKAGKIMITTSTGRTCNGVNEALYNQVKARYDQLPAAEKEMTSRYSRPNWDDCPCMIRAPYIPAIFTQVW